MHEQRIKLFELNDLWMQDHGLKLEFLFIFSSYFRIKNARTFNSLFPEQKRIEMQ